MCKNKVDLFQHTPRRMHTRRSLTCNKRKNMGLTEAQALTVHTRNNYKKKEKNENYHHNKIRTRNKRRPREILQMFDIILVMKRDALQEIVPSGK